MEIAKLRAGFFQRKRHTLLDLFIQGYTPVIPNIAGWKMGDPGLSRCMDPIKNWDIPASYVIVYHRVAWKNWAIRLCIDHNPV